MSSITIPLTRGKVAIVDAEDAERVNQFKWYAQPSGRRWYAIREARVDGKAVTVRMHRFVMDAPDDVEVDHINGDGLDNRRSVNLRLCIHADNSRNQPKAKNNTSGYKGVHFGTTGSWIATMRRDGEMIYLGSFAAAEDAALAYDHKARELDGEFARLNFPDVTTYDMARIVPPDRRALRSGERNNKAKLTWEQVREIRRRHAEGGIFNTQLAREYGVHPSIIGDVVNGKTWRE